MITKIIEATNGPRNHGKFLVGRFDGEEWRRRSEVDRQAYEQELTASPDELAAVLASQGPLLARCGWTPEHLLVLDLQTGEGGVFRPGGYAKADLDKHQVWVCPLFEPFLAWLYTQEPADLFRIDMLPDHVDLPDAPFMASGYRRPGSGAEAQPA